MNFNKQQLKAIDHFDGPCLVISIPGSGKTSVLVARAVELIEKGVDPASIFCVTFTNKAASEMKTRIQQTLKVNDLDMFVGTFHAFCVKVLRVWGSNIGLDKNFTILSSSDQESMIKMIAKKNGFKKKVDYDAFKILNIINKSREERETKEQLADRFGDDIVGWEISKIYFNNLKEQNVIDFSGLLYEVAVLLEDYPDVLKKLRRRFKYFMVDETQDTNYIQFHILNLLSGKEKNLMLVGDISQSVYKFRGARYQNILDFLKQNKNCVTIPLEKNYRSTPEIIKVADTLIKHNKSHMSDKFETDNPSGYPVQCKSFFSPKEEAEWIAQKIKYYKEDLGYDGEDIVIFYRLNRLAMDLQPALREAGIPFVIVGGSSFFDRKEIRDTLAMLRFLSNPKDSTAFYRVIDLCSKIGEVTAAKLHQLSLEKNIDLISACRQIDSLTNRVTIKKAAKKIASIFDFDYASQTLSYSFNYLMTQTQYMTILEKTAKDEVDYYERKDNLDAFMADAISSTLNSPKNLQDYLRTVSLISTSDQSSEGEAVTLMSLHASKGLEFSIVFMIGLEENLLPHYLALAEASGEKEEQEAIEEERRICYVGITRTKKHLHTSWCRKRKMRTKGGIIYKNNKPSRFLQESGLIKNANI